MATDSKARLIERVDAFALDRTSEMARRHNSCVSVEMGAKSIARLFRPERIPAGDAAISELARRIVDWALPLDRDAPLPPRPYHDDDLETAG